jgi:peptide/nickel transport system permease protein
VAAGTAGRPGQCDAIAYRHLLPNIMSLIIVQGTIQLSLGILAEAGLSYVGLGTQPPATSLGLMLRDAQGLFLIHPWLTLVPGLCIVLIVIALNLAGDGLARRHRSAPARPWEQPMSLA